MIRVEDFALVETERLDDVLVRVRVDRLFERLAQQELAALGRRDVAIGAEHDVVGGERVGRDEEAEVALDDAALVFGQAVRVFPQGDVARHVHFLRHPVVGATGQILFPRPLVLERHQLIDVGLAVDDALVGDIDARFASAAAMAPAWVAAGATKSFAKMFLRTRYVEQPDERHAMLLAIPTTVPAALRNTFCCEALDGVTAVVSSSQLSINSHHQFRSVCTIFS